MIRFLLDTGGGRVEEIALGDEVPADLTVLDWLRLHRGLQGTKEGCGSGDCGACTVVVASPVGAVEASSDDASGHRDSLHHESINACIAFVGTLHGRLLVTVESLANGDTLHPVQQAMLDEHGSQCGFCTPGFVMSLYALYRAPDLPRVRFDETLLGHIAGDGSAMTGEAARPLDLDMPTPVVAYRSAANAAAASETDGDERGGADDDTEDEVDGKGGDKGPGTGKAGRADEADEADEDATDGPGAPLEDTAPVTMTGDWYTGVLPDHVDDLSHRIDRALGGNLCRCTGYRPIKRAAVVALAAREAVGRTAAGRTAIDGRAACEHAVAARLRTLAATPPAHAGFHAPDSLATFAALRERHPDAPLLGGGTDLALEVTQKLRDLPRLIHVGRVPELAEVEIACDRVTFGAGVSLTRCMAVLGPRVPGAAELLLRFGSDPIRNCGTIGGNIASASPIGDLPPLLLALDATLVLQRGERTRTLPLDDFFTGYRETRLAAGEFIRAVCVPLPVPLREPLPASSRSTPSGNEPHDPGDHELVVVYKISKRMEDDISAVCGAFRLTFVDPADDERADSGEHASGTPASRTVVGRRIATARLAFGGMAATPARARGAEAALAGARFERSAIEAAGDALDDDFQPLDDARASASYRARVARNLLQRMLLEADEPAVPVRLSLGAAAGHAGDTHAER